MRIHDHERAGEPARVPATGRRHTPETGSHTEAEGGEALAAPSSASVVQLQRLAGNGAVAELIDGGGASPVLGVVGRGGGVPLEPYVRDEMERSLGGDFSTVRIHTDAAADASARSVGAEAYTVGDEVVFRQGRYHPDDPSGKRLLAHELTHVEQQRSGPVDGSNERDGVAVSDPGDRFERAASERADRVVAGGGPAARAANPAARAANPPAPAPAPARGAANGAVVQRFGLDDIEKLAETTLENDVKFVKNTARHELEKVDVGLHEAEHILEGGAGLARTAEHGIEGIERALGLAPPLPPPPPPVPKGLTRAMKAHVESALSTPLRAISGEVAAAHHPHDLVKFLDRLNLLDIATSGVAGNSGVAGEQLLEFSRCSSLIKRAESAIHGATDPDAKKKVATLFTSTLETVFKVRATATGSGATGTGAASTGLTQAQEDDYSATVRAPVNRADDLIAHDPKGAAVLLQQAFSNGSSFVATLSPTNTGRGAVVQGQQALGQLLSYVQGMIDPKAAAANAAGLIVGAADVLDRIPVETSLGDVIGGAAAGAGSAAGSTK